MTAPSTSAPNSLQVGLIVLSRRGGLPRPPYLGGFAPPTTPASRLRLAYPRPPSVVLTPAARRAPHAAAPLRRHSAPPLAFGRGPDPFSASSSYSRVRRRSCSCLERAAQATNPSSSEVSTSITPKTPTPASTLPVAYQAIVPSNPSTRISAGTAIAEPKRKLRSVTGRGRFGGPGQLRHQPSPPEGRAGGFRPPPPGAVLVRSCVITAKAKPTAIV